MERRQFMNRKWVLGCSLLLFIIACNLPALEFRRNENGQEIWNGGATLVMGWLGLFVGQLAWLANGPLFLAMVCLLLRQRRACLVFGGLALLLSCTTWTLFGSTLDGDEGGVNKLILLRLHAGVYVWQASMLVLFVGACCVSFAPPEPDSQPVTDWYHSGPGKSA